MPRLLLFVAFALSAAPAAAQDLVTLAAPVRPGDVARYDLTLTVSGTLTVDRGGKPDTVPVTTTASHSFVERVEEVTAAGRAGRVTRHYSEAKSAGSTGPERAGRALAADRRVVAARRTDAGTVHYAPAGPLTRDELDLVAEHFDPTAVPGLLPPAPVAVAATWPIPAAAVRHLCQFDGVVKADLVGTLASVTPTAATVTVAGTAEGVEGGAVVRVKVAAALTVDRATQQVTTLKWEQTDSRSQGPASPAADLTAVVTLTRTAAAEPPELAAGRAAVPADGQPTPLLLMLKYADPDGRYSFLYPREWRVVGRTADHLYLRLVEGGEFVAQATVTAWKPAAAGSHSSAAEFKQALGKLPGFPSLAVTADGEVPTDGGRWLYRVAAAGSRDGRPLAQTFYLLAGPAGDQVAVTVACRSDAAGRLGARDVALVNGVEFPARK